MYNYYAPGGFYQGGAVQSAPPPFSLPGQPQQGFINPEMVGNYQNNFVNQLASAQQQMYYQQPQEPRRDYYSWKLNNNVRPRTPEEEEYYLNYYNNVVYPQQYNAFYQNRYAPQPMMPQSNQVPYSNPYCNVTSIPGAAPMPMQPQFYYGSNNINPYLYGQYQSMQSEAYQKMQEQELAMKKRLHRYACQFKGYSEEEIEETAKYLEPINYEEEQKKEDEEFKKHIIRVRLVRGGKVVHKCNWEDSDEEILEAERYKYRQLETPERRARLLVAQQPQYIIVQKDEDYFKHNIEKYGNMSLVEFFNHGGELYVESLENQQRDKERYQLANSYNKMLYNNAIMQREDKGAVFNDGLFSVDGLLSPDKLKRREAIAKIVNADAPEGFHYDAKTHSITITAPDFSKRNPEIETRVRRRIAFYDLVMGKHPELDMTGGNPYGQT